MSIEIKEHSFNTGVVTLNYAEGPASGPPLVLLHGGSARWQAFETIIPDLAADWHLYAPDFRGHGQSGRVANGYRLQDYADDTIAFLRQQVSEPACIVGHSLGGMVALLVAAQCPECVQAVVVGDSPLTAETWLAVLNDGRDSLIFWRDLAGGAYSMEEIAEALKDAPLRVPDHDQPVRMRDVVGEDDPVFKWLAQNLYQHDPDMLTMLIDEPEIAAAGYDMAVVLPSIRCPVLLLQADPQAGGLLTDAEIERALPLLAQPTHVRLEGVSHVLHNEQKKPVLRAITDFLRTLFI
jgi:pimeloyl-ACP methyl ester carboxylesterase